MKEIQELKYAVQKRKNAINKRIAIVRKLILLLNLIASSFSAWRERTNFFNSRRYSYRCHLNCIIHERLSLRFQLWLYLAVELSKCIYFAESVSTWPVFLLILILFPNWTLILSGTRTNEEKKILSYKSILTILYQKSDPDGNQTCYDGEGARKDNRNRS